MSVSASVLGPAPRPRRYGFALTPLADAMFQLLIFFMLSSSLSPYSLIPLSGGAAGQADQTGTAAGAAPAAPAAAPVLWQLQRGAVRIGAETVALDDLATRLPVLLPDAQARVLLFPGRAANVQDIATVLELLGARGVTGVQIVGGRGAERMARGPLLPPPAPRRRNDFAMATVNIVLLLVLFFLIAGSMVQSGEDAVDLAETHELPLDRLPRPLLAVDADGAWALDGVAVAPDGLAAALGPVPPATLYVLADRDLPADALLALVQRPELAAVALQLVTLHLREDGA